MKKIFILSIFAINVAFGQSSVLIQPNGNNGILSQNTSAVTTAPASFTTPVSGAGTRLMWMPAKSAFRVGTVDYNFTTPWNAANIGTWSFAAGLSNVASGDVSTSFGSYTFSSGYNSTSMGYGSTASGDYSTSLGFYTTAQAYGSFVLGQYNVIAGTKTSWVATDPLFVIGNGNALNFTNNAMTVLKNGQVGIGLTSVATNEIMELNGRLRLHRNTFASGLWFNNSANETGLSNGAFIGLNNETSGSETLGLWLNGAFRFTVDRSGNTTTTGEVNRTQTSDANMVPIAYGNVNSDGTVNTAATTSNVSVSKSGSGVYSVTITGESFDKSTYTAMATINGPFFGIIATSGAGGLNILTANLGGTYTDMPFTFVVYKK